MTNNLPNSNKDGENQQKTPSGKMPRKIWVRHTMQPTFFQGCLEDKSKLGGEKYTNTAQFIEELRGMKQVGDKIFAEHTDKKQARYGYNQALEAVIERLEEK